MKRSMIVIASLALATLIAVVACSGPSPTNGACDQLGGICTANPQSDCTETLPGQCANPPPVTCCRPIAKH